MIINIPLTIPDELLENTIAKDYEAKITERLTDEVRKILRNYDNSYASYGKDPKKGLESLVHMKVDDVITKYKDDIIDAAADKLAERLARTKAAKEILEDNRIFEKAYDYQPLTDYNNMMKEADK